MKSLQQLLWERWGKPEYPAEWDGREGGGGKGSQRFWEYLWALDTLGLLIAPLGQRSLPARILDVGGGSCFFADLLAQRAKVQVVDPAPCLTTVVYNTRILYSQSKLELFVTPLGKTSATAAGMVYDWATCISVLEHIDDKPGFCSALDKFTCPISLTFEFGEGSIDMETVYDCLDSFKNHYLLRMELCPVWADNSAINKWRPMGLLLVPSARE